MRTLTPYILARAVNIAAVCHCKLRTRRRSERRIRGDTWSREVSGGIYTRGLSQGSAIVLGSQFKMEEPYRTYIA